MRRLSGSTRSPILAMEHVMSVARERYVVDESGKRVAVVLDMKAYRKMLADLEELEAVRAYDAAKAAHDEVVPFEEAVRRIERKRR